MRKSTKKSDKKQFSLLLFIAFAIGAITCGTMTYKGNDMATSDIQVNIAENVTVKNMSASAKNFVYYTSVGYEDRSKSIYQMTSITDTTEVEQSVEPEITSEPEVEQEVEIEAPDPSTESQIIHTIKSGDSYWGIAIKYYGRGNYCYALAEYNGITTDTILNTGDTLLIPTLNDPEFQKLLTGVVYNPSPDEEDVKLTYSDSYSYGKRVEPAVNIDIPDVEGSMKNYTEEVDTSNFTFWGECNITGYTPGCAHCCGGSTAGIGSSGVAMIPGYSVAMGSALPFGTTIYVEGYGFYVVEDRGVGNYHVDISAPSHDQCYDLTGYGVNVWIVN